MAFPVPLRLLIMGTLAAAFSDDPEWKCPEFNRSSVSCSCDLPHTLRCLTDATSLPAIAKRLRTLEVTSAVSLLDCTVENLTFLPGAIFDGVLLHGLVITSGEIRNVSERAFVGLVEPLQALGLPNNQLERVPTIAFKALMYLERLDLSHNKLKYLNFSSFKGLTNLTFLDLNDNQISDPSPDAFSSFNSLKTLRLKGNNLRVPAVAALTGLDTLEELDLSINALMGPLGPGAMPHLPKLETLLLSSNQFSSVRRGALKGASSLLSLSLNHNQIDVLEDFAFSDVSTLRSLDLANNRIVAVSGSSLAHLRELKELNLAHNFLRALTSDVIVPLTDLSILKLDDNDISMVDGDVLTENNQLERLTLADNPLNCDCTLAKFAVWFNNASRLAMSDRSTAVCATPPNLENGLLMEIPPSQMLCGEENDTYLFPPESPIAAQVPLSKSQVMLRAFQFDGDGVTLLWSVDSQSRPFTCDALFVYEEMNAHEVLLTSTPLRCNSSQLADPKTLTVKFPQGNMMSKHRYRYCVVLLEGGKFTDEMQLVLGCSEVIPLIVTSQAVAQPPRITSPTRIAALHANLTSNRLSISVQLWNQVKSTDVHCHITVTVFMATNLLSQHHLNCSYPNISIYGLHQGPYHVCATLGNYPPSEPRVQCIMVQNQLKAAGNVILTICFVILCTLILLGVYLVSRKILKQRKLLMTHQCFLAQNEPEEEGSQHSRYVKLQATTKL